MKLVYIKYQDHLLFKNMNPGSCVPIDRECIGWIRKENDKAMWIVWDRSVISLSHEKIQPQESGLVLLKTNVLEMRKFEL